MDWSGFSVARFVYDVVFVVIRCLAESEDVNIFQSKRKQPYNSGPPGSWTLVCICLGIISNLSTKETQNTHLEWLEIVTAILYDFDLLKEAPATRLWM